MLRPIRKIGDPILKKKAAKIDKIGAETRKLIADMIETMRSVHGIGLAAPQVGVSQRLAIVEMADPAGGEGATKLTVLINPEIVKASPDTWVAPEGCLSIPGWRGDVERPYQITVKALDRDGNRVRFDADGLLARAIQHEIDHLDGVLYIEKLVAPDRIWQVDENAPETA